MEYGNGFNNRNEDLTRVFDKRMQTNKGVNDKVQQRKKDINFKMFGIRDKEDIRRELREANSVNGQVDNLKQRVDAMNNNSNNGGFR